MTNESPYVCFRRREVKVARKTRRTDTQTIEKLVRLKSDLSSAQELLLKVLEREKCKRDSVVTDGAVFEDRVRMRTIKRRLGEAHGDEALLIPRREKKRKSGMAPQAPLRYAYSSFVRLVLSLMKSSGPLFSNSANKIVIPNRTTLASLAPGLLPDPLPPYKDKTAHALQRIDKDMQRKREQEFGWEDITDSAFMPLPQPLQSRFWRAPERLYRYAEGRKPAEIITFDQYNTPFIQIVGQRFRKRIGRGGRIHLDRLAFRRVVSQGSDEEGEEGDEEALERMRERWRYDSDVPQEIPASRYPMVLDDFDTKFAATRSRMLAVADWESVYPASSHLEEALRWTMREPDRPPPMQVIGKLPGQRIHAFAPQQPGSMQGMGTQGAANHQTTSRPVAVQHGGGGAGAQLQGVNGVVGQALRKGSNSSPAPGAPAATASSTASGNSPQQHQQAMGSMPSPGLAAQQPQIRRLMWENTGS